MQLSNFYYVFDKAIPSRICNEMMALLKKSKKISAELGGKENENKPVDLKIRHSKVAFDSSWWLYRWTHPYIHEANKLGKWNFQWNHSEICQLTEYKPGGFYRWHTDQNEPYSDKEPEERVRGKIRKLSSVLSLNDGTEYTGGELEFYSHSLVRKPWHETCKAMKNKGSIIIFPSFIWHRVVAVKKGVGVWF